MSAGLKAFFQKYGKRLVWWALISFCYFKCLGCYGELTTNAPVSVLFTASYPGQGQAEEILDSEKEQETPRDICFYRDGGRKNVLQEEYGRQAEVTVAEICGDSGVYDWRAAGLADAEGCVIDRETAVALFGSPQAVGGILSLDQKSYQVRRVVDWEQRLLLLCPDEKETFYTQVLLRTGAGESEGNAASQFLMRYGLSGTHVGNNGVRSLVFVVVLLLPAGVVLELFGSALREQRRAGENTAGYWIWGGVCMLTVAAVIFGLFRFVQIPADWLPGKWSDFQFWADKAKETASAFRLYLMMPKTAVQADQLLKGGAAALWGTASFLSYCIQKR